MLGDPVEVRVLGCLVEKQRTTPESYPLSLNGLRLACNQATNRDPVVEYDESTIRAALTRLSERGLVRLASGRGSRAVKYRHLLDEKLSLAPPLLSLIAVVMLRGPQTPGELKQRTERLHRFESTAEVEGGLEELARRDLVERLPRRPGQKEQRYALADVGRVRDTPAAEASEPSAGGVEERLDALEARVQRLEQRLSP